MKLLDRYILKNFFVPFAYSFLGFIAIWLIIDLTDNASDFISGHKSFGFVAYFYATQLPAITILILPIAILLSLLYALSRMSRSNEIIAMLTSGRSVLRILLPLFIFGLLATGVSYALNDSLAPHAAAVKERLLAQARGDDSGSQLSEILFHSNGENRTWYIRTMIRDPMTQRYTELRNIHVTQQDADGNIVAKYYAARASYNPADKTWNLRGGKTVRFDKSGGISKETYWKELSIPNWRETPQQIATANLDPDHLSVAELQSYLQYNAHFPAVQLAPYETQLQSRRALPWSCFIVILIGASLGIVYSRRGILAGVALAIFLYFALFSSGFLFDALGKGARISPWVSAWVPPLFFAAIGLFLLNARSANRDLTQFTFWKRAPKKTKTTNSSLTANAN